MLATANLTMQFGDKPLFENVSVKFEEGGRYGLIGANGAGKSTLVKIFDETVEPTAGSVIVGPALRVGSLGQDQFAFEEYAALDTVTLGYKEFWEIKQERDRLYSLPEMTEEEGIKVADLEVKFAELDGYSAEARAGELLSGVGIPVEMHTRLMREIPPGLKVRVLLTQVLFANPDILLLDEPTNNLDIDTIRWLENELAQRNSTMIIISHDRHFLNRICTHMADLDYAELRLYPGNYDDYMTVSMLARERMLADRARSETRIKELQVFINRFKAKASKAKQAKSRARQVEKIKLEDIKPSSRRAPYLRFEPGKKLHRIVLETNKLTNGYDDDIIIFKGLTLSINAGEKVAIIGPSGIGRTTLARTLIKELNYKKGTMKWAENVKFGYFPQYHKPIFDEDITVFEWMSQWRGDTDDDQSVRGILGRLLFSGPDYDKKINVLSGGERARMLLGKIILTRPNVLIMDEPTGHLDMESIEALNLALEEFPGTVFLVSHDRELVSSLATRIIAMTQEGVKDFKGTYDEYLFSIGE